LEAFLWKVATWPVCFPRTLWRVLRNPIAVSLYTRRQLEQQPDRRFSGMLSPPLMLALSIVLAHLLGFAIPDRPSPLVSGELPTLLVRSFSYGLYALMPAMAMLCRLLDLPLLPATFIAISRFVVATLIVLALMDLLRFWHPGSKPLAAGRTRRLCVRIAFGF
ncbi:hypothetical protein ACFPU0_24105, partial [Pseudomonas sp. GCM10022186]|uniref:hypothetical protein n=1 Tax=Pseudomonas sp. GCM10022186 TaxID=3252650 RepID=UPI003608488D